MKTDQIIEILKTRQKIAEEDGNTTEFSFLGELLMLAEKHKAYEEGKKNGRC